MPLSVVSIRSLSGGVRIIRLKVLLWLCHARCMMSVFVKTVRSCSVGMFRMHTESIFQIWKKFALGMLFVWESLAVG